MFHGNDIDVDNLFTRSCNVFPSDLHQKQFSKHNLIYYVFYFEFWARIKQINSF